MRKADIFDTLKDDNVGQLTALLKEGAKPDQCDDFDVPLIERAAERQCVKIVRHLLNLGERSDNLLMRAAMAGPENPVLGLIESRKLFDIAAVQAAKLNHRYFRRNKKAENLDKYGFPASFYSVIASKSYFTPCNYDEPVENPKIIAARFYELGRSSIQRLIPETNNSPYYFAGAISALTQASNILENSIVFKTDSDWRNLALCEKSLAEAHMYNFSITNNSKSINETVDHLNKTSFYISQISPVNIRNTFEFVESLELKTQPGDLAEFRGISEIILFQAILRKFPLLSHVNDLEHCQCVIRAIQKITHGYISRGDKDKATEWAVRAVTLVDLVSYSNALQFPLFSWGFLIELQYHMIKYAFEKNLFLNGNALFYDFLSFYMNKLETQAHHMRLASARVNFLTLNQFLNLDPSNSAFIIEARKTYILVGVSIILNLTTHSAKYELALKYLWDLHQFLEKNDGFSFSIELQPALRLYNNALNMAGLKQFEAFLNPQLIEAFKKVEFKEQKLAQARSFLLISPSLEEQESTTEKDHIPKRCRVEPSQRELAQFLFPSTIWSDINRPQVQNSLKNAEEIKLAPEAMNIDSDNEPEALSNLEEGGNFLL